MIERTHLKIIDAVERLGSLTAAAEELCVTQSALSHTIRKLESNLGAEVWVREGRRLRLTPAGHYLITVAHRVLPLLNHAEEKLAQVVQGERGVLRIGMECHPCYQWLLNIVSPFLRAWPDVDVDVKQEFQFGGLDALLDYEIDLLVTPDPVYESEVNFEPVFDYEQVLVVPKGHSLANLKYAQPEDMRDQTLLTYPVCEDRLDIFTQFLAPTGIHPKEHNTCEDTDIMIHMVASGRGVAAIPRWLGEEYCSKLPLSVVQLGKTGIAKQIHLATRESDADVEYLTAFVGLARSYEAV